MMLTSICPHTRHFFKGASELNMSVVIDSKDVDKAVELVHGEFLEQKAPSE